MVDATGNAAITVGATANTVNVNDLESITFSANATGLTINGAAGNDTFNVTPAGVALASGGIAVNGTGGTDALTVNATGAIGYKPTGAEAGSVTTASPTLTFAGVSAVAINGESGGDTLTITSPAPNEVSFTTGATVDSGSLTFSEPFGGTGTLTPVQFSDLGGAGSLAIVDAGGGIDFNGSDEASAFDVSSAGVVQLFKPLGGGVEETLPITATGSAVRLIGHSGNDTFNVPGNQPFGFGLQVQGAAGNNTLNFVGDGTGAVTVDLAAQTVTEAGFAPVSFSGVTTLNVNADGAALAVDDATAAAALAVTPLTASSATIQAYTGGTARTAKAARSPP